MVGDSATGRSLPDSDVAQTEPEHAAQSALLRELMQVNQQIEPLAARRAALQEQLVEWLARAPRPVVLTDGLTPQLTTGSVPIVDLDRLKKCDPKAFRRLTTPTLDTRKFASALHSGAVSNQTLAEVVTMHRTTPRIRFTKPE